MVREAAVPSRLQQGCTLMLAAALVTAGVAGGQWFMEADYVVYGFEVWECERDDDFSWKSVRGRVTLGLYCCRSVATPMEGRGG